MSLIEVNKLVKQYNKAKTQAVDGVSFVVNEGEFFAFLGPNGKVWVIPKDAVKPKDGRYKGASL